MIKNPGLIIYKPQRFQVGFKNCMKYGFFPHKLTYTGHQGKKKYENTYHGTNKYYLREFKANISPQNSNYKSLVKYLTHAQNIKKVKLVLKYGITNKDKITEMKHHLRKLFAQLKRMTHIEISLYQGGQDGQKLFKTLSFSKFLKTVKLRICTDQSSTLEDLGNFLISAKTIKKSNFPLLQSRDVLFGIQPAVQDENRFNEVLITLVQMLDKINQNKLLWDNNEIKLILPLSQPPRNTHFEALSNVIKNLSNLKELALASAPEIDYSCLLQAIQSSESLQYLNLYFSGHQSNSILSTLSESLFKIKTLRKLTLWMSNPQSLSIDYFFENLCKFTQITSLVFNFKGLELINFDLLSRSLLGLSNLQFLDLTMNKELLDFQITKQGVQTLFETFGQMINLKEIYLCFNNYTVIISDEEFSKLCGSFKKLTNLRTLKLIFMTNNIGNKGIVKFGESISQLKSLDAVTLDISGNQCLDCQSMGRFFQSIKDLRNISSFTFRTEYIQIDQYLYSSLVNTLFNFKSLNYLELRLIPPHAQKELYNYLCYELLKQFHMKFEVKL